MLTTAASSKGYGSGASARILYALRNAVSALFVLLVRLSISVWYAMEDNVNYTHPLTTRGPRRVRIGGCAPLSSPLNSPSFSSSGSFLNSVIQINVSDTHMTCVDEGKDTDLEFYRRVPCVRQCSPFGSGRVLRPEHRVSFAAP